MITTIARKEFVGLLRDGRYRWAVAITVATLVAAILTSARYQRDLVEQQRQAQATEQKRWYGQSEKNPHSAAHYGLYAFKPRLAPAFLDPGIEPYTGVTVWIEAHKQNDMLFRPAQDATTAQRFGDLTLATLFQSLVPLVIVLLAFTAFVGERERGTLRQLLSLGVRPHALVLGKALGLIGGLGLVVVPALALGGIALAWAAPAAGFERFILMAGLYLLYLGIFLFVCLAVSARARSSQSALVILLAFWATNCLVAPRVMAAVAARAHPLPDYVALKAKMKAELGDPEGAPAQLKAKVAALMKEHGVSRQEDLPINIRGLSLQTGEEHGYAVFGRFYGQLYGAMEAQNQLVTRAGLLFPQLGLQALSMALAGTDLAQHRDFVNAAEAHRQVIQKLMNDEITKRPLKPGEVFLAGRELWEKVPPFVYEPRRAAEVLKQNLTSVVWLLTWFVGAAWWAWRGASRLRPV